MAGEESCRYRRIALLSVQHCMVSGDQSCLALGWFLALLASTHASCVTLKSQRIHRLDFEIISHARARWRLCDMHVG